MSTDSSPSYHDHSSNYPFLLIWVDSTIDFSDSEKSKTLEQIGNVVQDVRHVYQSAECIDILNQASSLKCLVILSSNSDYETLLPQIHSINRLEAVFILTHSPKAYETCGWSKVRGTYQDIESLREELPSIVHQLGEVDNSMLILSSPDDSCQIDLNKLEPSFMYTTMLKNVFLEIDFSQRNVQQMLAEFSEKYKDNPSLLHNLRHNFTNYKPANAIAIYTRSIRVFTDVNRALRLLNVHMILLLGFFIKDLHQQIEKLYRQQISSLSEDRFVVYRGQSTLKKQLAKIKASKNCLIGFNSFLSTSKKKSVAQFFAENSAKEAGHVGLLFHIVIYSNLGVVPFADISEYSGRKGEEEILLSMNAIFRIKDIQVSTNLAHGLELSLELTDNDDPQLMNIREHISQRLHTNPKYRLGQILQEVGSYSQAETIYLDLLKQTTEQVEQAQLNQSLGIINNRKGKYDNALTYFYRQLKLFKSIPGISATAEGNVYAEIGLAYSMMRKYDEAVPNYKMAIAKHRSEPCTDNNLIDSATVYNNIGLMYHTSKKYDRAITYYEKAIEIQLKELPSNHPSLAETYNNLASTQVSMGKYLEAKQALNRAFDIKKQVLPSFHPSFFQFHNSLGVLLSNMGEYSEAIDSFKKALEIKQQIQPKSYRQISQIYEEIGALYIKEENRPEALLNYEKSLELQKKSNPINHHRIKRMSMKIALLCMELKNYSGALSAYQTILTRDQKDFPEEDSRIAATHFEIGKIYYEMKKYHQSLQSFEKARCIRALSLPLAHPDREATIDWIKKVKKAIK